VSAAARPGPLAGTRVIELAGIGPTPHAAMMLADLGAEVVRVERPDGQSTFGGLGEHDASLRGRRWVRADLKQPDHLALVLGLVERADVLVEGYRPGVAERLGIGPDDCLGRNPRLVYARMTGWGQHGPRAGHAGHDLNYVAITGALGAMGRPDDPPAPPLNLVADYGGGSMLLLVGVLAALLEREQSGRGQVVDAAMVDGVSLLSQLVWSMLGAGAWSDRRGANLLDGGCPFYDCYRCADGRYVAVAALEPGFFAAFVDGLGLDPQSLPAQYDVPQWPRLRRALAARLATRTRDEWSDTFADTDACVTPVLTWSEARSDEQLRVRGSLVDIAGVVHAAPAPRFSRSGTRTPQTPQIVDDTAQVVADWQHPRRGRP
jgi:alpha-methylacyl-CoA racemase